jgi:flavin-dependent dehydrogenase
MRAAAIAEPGVTTVVGNVSDLAVDGNRVRGVVVDGRPVEANLVIDASGRTGRFAHGLRAPGDSQDSGFAYVSRQYQLLPDAQPGPLNSPPGWGGTYQGYLVIIFVQDAGTFQVLIVRPATDRELARLRHDEVFDTAAQAIPSIATWVDPERAKPNGPTMTGGHLLNAYRGQLGADGRPAADGILFVGDAVLTTNPAAGRGVSTSLMQARHALAALDEHGADLAAVAGDLDEWCEATMRPWYDDHVAWDAGLLSRWRGEDIDFGQPLPSDLICSLAEADKSVMPIVGAYQAMLAGPSVLAQIEERARANLRSGFRPSVPDGPTRDELAARIAHVAG